MKQIFNSRNKTFHNSIKKLSMIIFLFLPFLILANDFTIVKNGKVVIGLEPTPLEPSVFEAAAIVENYLYKATNNMPQIVSKGKRIIFKL